MRKRIKSQFLTFSGKDAARIMEFREFLNPPGMPPLSYEEIIQKLIFRGMDSVLKEAQDNSRNSNQGAADVSRNATGNSPETRDSQDASPAPLAESTSSATAS